MKFVCKKGFSIPEILNAIGNPNIKSTEVSLKAEGDNLEIDFGTAKLTNVEKLNLKNFLSKFGYSIESEIT
jgi:hypothetical protein